MIIMKSIEKNVNKIYSELALVSLILLIFFQLISDLVESIYIECLLSGSLNENVVGVIALLSPFMIFILGKGKEFSNKGMVVIGEIMVVSRIVEAFLVKQAKILFSAIGIACFFIYFSLYYLKKEAQEEEKEGLVLGLGLALALSLTILLRVLGSSLDISTYGLFQWIGWVIAFLATIMIMANSLQISTIPFPEKSTRMPSSKKKIIGLSLGLIGILIVGYFTFSSPTVIARWTEMNYFVVIILLVVMISLFVIIASHKPEVINRMNRKVLLTWNVLFVLFLAFTIAINQIIFIDDPAYYPIIVLTTSIWQQIPAIIMLILSPIIFIDFTLFSRELIKGRPSARTLGGSFTLATLFFLLIIFANIFTAVWDYIPVVGGFFRDMYWVVFMVAGLAAALPSLLVMKRTLIFKVPIFDVKNKLRIILLIGIISMGTIAGIFIVESKPIVQVGDKTTLTILTYNVQQGVNEPGIKNFEDQIQLIKSVDPDIISLVETDTARIAGGNSDLVRKFANSLNLYSYYGPKTVTSTFGVALLSKYPIKNAKTFYLYSLEEWSHKREQAACIEAEITIGTRTFNVFVTHLGNGAPIIETQEIMERVKLKTNVILMGDFNFRTYYPNYAITTKILVDSWEVAKIKKVSEIPVDAGPIPEERIDHVFLSPTFKNNVAYGEYFGGTASDHPAYYTILNI